MADRRLVEAGFCEWLPGELVYSVRKANYPAKIKRAGVQPPSDPESMGGFLGAEWHHAGLMTRSGIYYRPEHQKSGQLQYAKFAAGIFDKYALLYWLYHGEYTQLAEDVAKAVAQHLVDLKPWEKAQPIYTAAQAADTRFSGSIFSGMLETVASEIHRVATLPDGRERRDSITALCPAVIGVGTLAAAQYFEFAQTHLTDGQCVLPQSHLAVTLR